MSERILVTSGLPYANGSIHLGHLVETLQTDIFVRALKLAGKDAIYCCGDDTHGTPIEVNARKRGIEPEAFVKSVEKEHVEDYARFGVHFDGYYSTHHETNRRYAEEIYEKLKARGWIERRPLEQLFCETDQRFLPDRFVRGVCPKCGAADQYGDVCEVCGSTYQPTDLKNARCVLCGNTPVLRTSEHAFFVLERAKKEVAAWLDAAGHVQPEIRNFVGTWLNEGLRDWCITRDGPYFGFSVPDMPGKYFYVWLDAPIGYIASTHRTAVAMGRTPDDYWRDPSTRIVHVIGKDIVYFHAIFWPAVLAGSGFTLPDKLHVHGMLRVNGEKMSKTRGTFINARTFAEHLDPQYLRFYYATKLTAKVEDIDFAFDDFVNRTNAELVNKIANLYSRVVPFVSTKLDGRLGKDARAGSTEANEVRRLLTLARDAFLSIDSAAAMQHILAIADLGNKYFQDHKPWELMKNEKEAARDVCTFVVNVCKAVTIGIKPVLPKLAETTEAMLGCGSVDFQSPLFDLVDRAIGEPRRLVERIEMKQVEAIVEASKVEAPVAVDQAKAPPEPVKAEIAYDQFGQVDLRAGKIVTAERVPKSDKLLKLQVDVGEAAPRQVIAGIGLAYTPEQVLGKVVVCCVNLKPAKLMGHESRGMLLAAGPGGKDLALVELPAATAPGSLVK